MTTMADLSRPTDELRPPWEPLLRWMERTRWGWFAGLALLYAAGANGRWRATADGSLYLLEARQWAGELPGAGGIPGAGAFARQQPGLTVLSWLAGGSAEGWLPAAIMLGFAAVVLVLTYLVFRRLALPGGRGVATLAVVLVGSNRLFYEASFGWLTELPFTAGLMLTVWGHERWTAGGRRSVPGAGVWLGVVAVVAGLGVMAAFRSVAAVVLAAYLAAQVPRFLRAGCRVGLAWLSLAVAGGMALWFGSSAVRDDAGILWRRLTGLSAAEYGENAGRLMLEVWPEALFGLDVPPPLHVAGAAVCVVAVVGVWWWRRWWGVLVTLFALQWVVFLSEPRYVLPLVPLWVMGWWRAVTGLVARWREPWRGWAWGAVVFGVVGANGTGVGFVVAEQRADDFYAIYRGGKYDAVRAMAETLRRETPEDAWVLTTWDVRPELSVWSRRPVEALPPEALPPERLAENGSAHLIRPADPALEAMIRDRGWTVGPPAARVPDPAAGIDRTLHGLTPPGR